MATSIGVKLKMDGESEFRKGLQNITSETKSLDKQLSALESSFEGEKKSIEENSRQTELLEKKKAALERQIEETNKALEYARDNYEEGSKEISSWEGALADAEKELNQTNSRLEENAEYATESTSALGQLTSEIESQTSELESLRDAYIDAVLQYGEGSDEANALAGQISTLNGELQANKDKLAEASASADGLTTSLQETNEAEEDVGDFAVTMGSQFGGSISSMVSAIAQGGIAGAMVAIGQAIVEVTEQMIDMRSEFEEGMSIIQIGTGKAEEELIAFTNAANEANAAIIGLDTQSASDAVAMLSTRLNLTAEDSEYATEQVGKFYKVLGVDTTSAVNGAVDAMYQWGMVTGDSAQDTETLVAILDMLTVAQQNAPVSVESLTDTLATQSVAYQSLGLSMTDAVSMIDSYVNHGGNMADVTTAAYNIFKNLNGEVDSLPEAFGEIIDKVSNSTDAFATMSETVGDTGKTIEDILGAKKAGAIINTFSTAGASVHEFDASLKDTSGVLDTLYNDSITTGEQIEYFFGKNLDNAWYNTVKVANGMSDLDMIAKTNNLTISEGSALLSKLTPVGEGWSKTVSSMTGEITSLTDETTKTTYTFDSLGQITSVTIDGVEQNVRDMKKEVTKQFEDMTNSVTDDYNTMRNDLSDPIAIHISAPKIEYATSGGTETITPSSGGRITFARAYDQAMILSAPTIFGAMGNSLLVGGDRPGNEIVVGEQHLMEMIAKASGNNIVLNVYGAEGQSEEALADAVIDKLQRTILGSEAVYA